MIVARVMDPASKLATARQLDAATATASLGPLLQLDTVSEQDLYAALDWLLSQQSRIERCLAQRHLSRGTLVLYDVSSTWFEGRTCPLARRGRGVRHAAVQQHLGRRHLVDLHAVNAPAGSATSTVAAR